MVCDNVSGSKLEKYGQTFVRLTVGQSGVSTVMTYTAALIEAIQFRAVEFWKIE